MKELQDYKLLILLSRSTSNKLSVQAIIGFPSRRFYLDNRVQKTSYYLKKGFEFLKEYPYKTSHDYSYLYNSYNSLHVYVDLDIVKKNV